MDIQAALSRIENRFNDLATKEDITSMQREIGELRKSFLERISAIEGKLFEVEAHREKQEREMKQLRKKNEALENMIRGQDCRIREVEKEQNELEQYSRRCHLRVFRVAERENETAEDCVKKVCAVFTDGVGIDIKPADIEVAHRTGKPSSDRPRPILVRFFDRKRRDRVLINRRRLKGKGTSVGEDLTSANYKLLRSAMEHSATMSAWASAGRIFAKLKNGGVIRVNIHTNLEEAFRRAMSPCDISIDEQSNC